MSTNSDDLPLSELALPRPRWASAAESQKRRATDRERHCTATIFLHWATAVGIVVAIASIYLRDLVEDSVFRQALMQIHRQLGLLVLLGLGLRLAVRFTAGLADHSRQMPFALRLASWMTHVGLYLLLMMVPLLGWAATSAHGIRLQAFGLLPLPGLVAADSDLSETLDELHQWTAWALCGLVAMHALAALWHHFARKDAVLAAMLPRMKRTQA
jgi:cytochrome b561